MDGCMLCVPLFRGVLFECHSFETNAVTVYALCLLAMPIGSSIDVYLSERYARYERIRMLILRVYLAATPELCRVVPLRL